MRDIGCNNRTMPEEVSTIDELAVVTAFNDAINARDLDRLGALMTDAHRFVDSVGATVDGKDACLDAWRTRVQTPPALDSSLFGDEREGVTHGG